MAVAQCSKIGKIVGKKAGKLSQLPSLDILFSLNHNIHKSLHGLCFWASDPLIDEFYKNLSIKGSEAQKQKPHELLWTLWLEKKSISMQQS